MGSCRSCQSSKPDIDTLRHKLRISNDELSKAKAAMSTLSATNLQQQMQISGMNGLDEELKKRHLV